MGRGRGPLGHEAMDTNICRLERLADIKAGGSELVGQQRGAGGAVLSHRQQAAALGSVGSAGAPSQPIAARPLQEVPTVLVVPMRFGENFNNRAS